MPPDKHREEHSITTSFLPKMHNLNLLIMWKTDMLQFILQGNWPLQNAMVLKDQER